jgi:hypothetical protein
MYAEDETTRNEWLEKIETRFQKCSWAPCFLLSYLRLARSFRTCIGASFLDRRVVSLKKRWQRQSYAHVQSRKKRAQKGTVYLNSVVGDALQGMQCSKDRSQRIAGHDNILSRF